MTATLRRNPLFLLALLSLCAVFTSACRQEQPLPEPAAPERRFAVLSPALAEMLREMGGEDLMVARHGFDRFSDNSLPVVGDQSGFNYEALLRSAPTHILMEPSVNGRPDRLRRLAEQEGWSLVELPTLTLQNVASSTEVVKAIIGDDEAESRFRDWRDAWDAALSPLEAPHPAPRPVVLMGTDPPAALGPGSVHYQLLQRLGCDPVPSDGGPYQTLALEDLALLGADTIVLLAPGSEEEAGALIGPLKRLDIAPVREGRVVVVRDPMCLIPSVSLVRTLGELRAGLTALGPPAAAGAGGG